MFTICTYLLTNMQINYYYFLNNNMISFLTTVSFFVPEIWIQYDTHLEETPIENKQY